MIGYNIWGVILDFTGGFLSLVQLCLDCLDLNDFGGIIKNWPKLVLAVVTLLFNVSVNMAEKGPTLAMTLFIISPSLPFFYCLRCFV